MATFTIALKDVIEMEKGNIGLDDYPLFDPDYRDELNQKIINHFWNREIGQETISMFRFNLRRKMHEIMPLYNEHYKLSLHTVDPLKTISIKNLTTNDMSVSTEAESVTGSESKAKSRAVGSDFPQMMLSENGDYASNASDNISESGATGTGTENSTQTQTGTVDNTTEGFHGHQPTLILAARQALVNVDMMVLNELQELFMLVLSNSDSYTGRRGWFRYGLY